MAEVSVLDPKNFEFQDYNSQDTNLISSFEIDTTLTSSSCIEFFILDLNGNILSSKYDYKNYTILNDSPSSGEGLSQFTISPAIDTLNNGFGNGQYNAYYSFLNKRIGDYNLNLFISEISSDRTEIRLDSNSIPLNTLITQTSEFIEYRNEQNYFVDFFINFGNNQLIIANNIKLEDESTTNPTVIVKLYEPLPSDFQLKDPTWVVTEFADPQAFNVANTPSPIFQPSIPFLQGPNFSIPTKNEVNNSSQNLSYNDIIDGGFTGSQNQINSILSQSSIDISINYNNFPDFIHFSSAETRIENFYYKVGLIQTYTSQSNSLNSVSGSSTSKLILDKKISNIITNFDKFEYFMYYSPGDGTKISYPKVNSSPPYILYPTTSSNALSWLGSQDEGNSNYGGQLLSASNYDNGNPDQLLKSIPEYLREDSSNLPYDLFVDMVAQYYDNVWMYTKDITQKYNADNRLDFGVSKDLVSDAIKDFGVKLYQNNFSNSELYTAFLGITPSGSLFPFPEITETLPVPTGQEYVNTLISASNDVISMDDTNKSLYKRIYHNIPYLLKSKGTTAGLRALITSYGIPDTILKISEFGGKDKVNTNDWDLYSNNFNYAYKASQSFQNKASINTNWHLNSNWGPNNNVNGSHRVPNTLQFRFKVEDTPPTTNTFPDNTSTLWVAPKSPSEVNGSIISLEYEGTGLTSGSYDGSIKDPNYQYAHLKFYPDGDGLNSAYSASVYLPFYNGDWWSVMLTSGSGGFELTSANKIYNGADGTSIGYIASSSIQNAPSVTGWNDGSKGSRFNQTCILKGETLKPISGAYQEIRYYNTRVSKSAFKDFVMNPLSYEGYGVNGAPNQLAFRAALGSEGLKLDITPLRTSSIHPKVTGSWDITQSFTSNSNFLITDGTITQSIVPNTEYFFLDQPAAGIKNRVTDKIRSENSTIPSGAKLKSNGYGTLVYGANSYGQETNTFTYVLSPIRSLSQTTEASASFTDNINYLEVAFSPQNQINNDIIGQIGNFNIGDYIGDPRQRSSSAEIYPDLNNLSKEYFQKYIKSYDLVDFVRLIKFFDNSLFKMIKDFIPARTSLASGLVVKQHLLERNKYPQPQIIRPENITYSGSINSHKIWNSITGDSVMSSSIIESTSGGAGGSVNPYNVSYNLDSISGSELVTNYVSGSNAFAIISSNNTISWNTGNNPIPSITAGSTTLSYPFAQVTLNGGFGDFQFFSQFIKNDKTIVPNLWVQIVSQSAANQGGVASPPYIQNNLPLAFNGFHSGSAIIPNPISASGTAIFNGAGGTNNFVVGQQSINTPEGIEFSKFASEGYVQFASPIFNTPQNLISNTSSFSVNVVGPTDNIITTFPTKSVSTSVSGSSPLKTISTGSRTFTLTNNTGATTNASNYSFFSASEGYAIFNQEIFQDIAGNLTSASAYTDLNNFRIITTNQTQSTSTPVSASLTLTLINGGISTFNIDDSATNAQNLDFSQFKDGYIVVNEPIFNNNINPYIASLSSSIDNIQLGGGGNILTADFPTQSLNTAVSASFRLKLIDNQTSRFTFTNISSSNAAGGELSFFETFGNTNPSSTFLSASNDYFVTPGGSGLTSQSFAPIQLFDTTNNELRVNPLYTTASLFTQYFSGSFVALTGSAITSPQRWTISQPSIVTNAPGGLNNETLEEGFVAAYTNNDGTPGSLQSIFVDSLGNSTPSSSIAFLQTGSSKFRPTLDMFDGSGIPSSVGYIFILYQGAYANGIFNSVTNPSGAQSTFTQSIGQADPKSFELYSGSIENLPNATNSFISSSTRTVGTLSATIYSGSLSKGTGAGSNTTFISQSNAVIGSGLNFTLFSGSLAQHSSGEGNSQTFISESARNISNLAFTFRSSSNGGTTFISSSIGSASYSRAHVASLTGNARPSGNPNDFNSQTISINLSNGYSFNSTGASQIMSGIGGFVFYTSETGNTVNQFTFSSQSIQQSQREVYYPEGPVLFPNVTQSFVENFPTLQGNVKVIHRSQDEFYNGELSGSALLVTNGELNEGCATFKNPSFELLPYKLRNYTASEAGFLNALNSPTNGYIQTYFGPIPIPPLSSPLPFEDPFATCFAAGTHISLLNGDVKNIEDIVVGDEVLGWDGKKIDSDIVIATDDSHFVGSHAAACKLLGDEPSLYTIDNTGIEFTPEHPFLTKDGWKSLVPNKNQEPYLSNKQPKILQVGDSICIDSEWKEIEDIRIVRSDAKEKVYNITVDRLRSYVANGIIVHNK